jgi:hypothetical protein
MCLVCKDWIAGKLTSKEALSNLGELIGMKGEADLDPKIRHYYDAVNKILDKEVPLSQNDEELDQSWHEETHDG